MHRSYSRIVGVDKRDPITGMAQAYPTRPVTMIVPFASGRCNDVIGRFGSTNHVCYDVNVWRAFGEGNLMLRIEVEEETDGRFIAEVPDLPGVMAYGQSRDEAIVKVEALALRALADRVENGEQVPGFPQIFSAA